MIMENPLEPGFSVEKLNLPQCLSLPPPVVFLMVFTLLKPTISLLLGFIKGFRWLWLWV